MSVGRGGELNFFFFGAEMSTKSSSKMIESSGERLRGNTIRGNRTEIL